ncbi:hypothetical protein GH714_017827 [Hevea brasiliensis]|uniref:WAT1-related protein n=1 Tax=Hevea brasiliensis TaxID=3981 RepID=A0A6A6LL67_HEVBR|nr:hypothetical protein GH714_017827 [Hevea brasiliensis]
MKNQLGCCLKFLETSKPYFAMISLQFGYAGMNIITKVSLNRGMSHYVLVVYRHAFATAVIAPFAFIFERKAQPRITFPIFLQLFVLGLLGPVIDQNFYYAGLKFTSPTFSCAMSNMLPAMTFDGEIRPKEVEVPSKNAGTLVTVAGAMLMTLYKGPIVEMVWSKHVHPRKSYVTDTTGTTDKDWFKGSILLIFATLAWASLFVLQVSELLKFIIYQSFEDVQESSAFSNITCVLYGHPTSYSCDFCDGAQSLCMENWLGHEPSCCCLCWDCDIKHFILCPRIGDKEKGPVFATAFSPLMMIIVAILGSFILAEKINLGGVIGAILIVIGLYSVLWGKHKERMEDPYEIPEPVKGVQGNGNSMTTIEDIEANEVIDLQKAEANSKLSALAISMPMPMPELPIKATQEPKD